MVIRWLGYLLGAVLVLGTAVAAPAGLRVYHTVPRFSLVSASGAEFDSGAELAGKVWVGVFFLTQCHGPCPMMLNRLSTVFRSVEDERLRIVAMTVDPETNSPVVLSRYAESFSADERWRFLTGPREQIKTLLDRDFKVGFSEVPQAHSTNLVLVDSIGQVRGYYSGVRAEEFDRLAADLAQLLAEQPPAPGAALP